MSRARKIVTGAIALAAIGYLARLSLLVAYDWVRSDKVRAMSDEGPLNRELPSIAARTILDQGTTIRELGAFALTIPSDVARYLRVQTM